VEVLSRRRNPFSILTKSSLIVRDIDLLSEAAGRTRVSVAMSIGTGEDAVARITEPGAASPSSRLEAISRLAAAGLRPSVLMAPILPGISDGEEQIRRLTRACLDAGADHVSPILLHLRPGVREHYFEWLERELPALVDLHQDAYRAGPYGLRQDRERVASIVRDELSVRAGGCPADSGSAGGNRTRIPQRTHRGP